MRVSFYLLYSALFSLPGRIFRAQTGLNVCRARRFYEPFRR